MINLFYVFSSLIIVTLLLVKRHHLIREREKDQMIGYTQRFMKALYQALKHSDMMSAYRLAKNYESRADLPTLLASLNQIENPMDEDESEVCRGYIHRYLNFDRNQSNIENTH